jgi:menaquinone-dependent protoporphyrinogen oxidase
MRVLVTYASRHGATQGIAERIGARLKGHGLEVATRPVDEAGEVPGYYDAFVIGSAAYMGHWLKEATEFVRRHRTTLATRPVWIFSSGPLGTEIVDVKGKDVRSATQPKEFTELRAKLNPRGTRVFFGAYDPEDEPIGLAEKLMSIMPSAREALPAGDFRDWHEIDAWADAVASELAREPVTLRPGG